VSKGLNWVDYSYGLAYVLEATAVTGAIFHIPDWFSSDTVTEEVIDDVVTPVIDDVVTPIQPLEWRVIESNMPPYQTENEINVWQLTSADKSALRQLVAEYLYTFRSRTTKLTITGHASPVGTEAYNLWLSQKRAQAVYDFIRGILTDDEYLILPQNTIIQGYGELYANILGARETDYANILGARETDSVWQTAMVHLNGQLVLQIGESIQRQ